VSPRSTTATICGSAANRSSTDASPGTTTASRSQLALGLRPDPRHLLQPSAVSRLAQLRERADAEHPPDLEHALDRDAQEACEAGELRRDLALELPQLGDLAGLDQLAQPPLDSRPDAAQLAHSSGAHQIDDGHGKGTHQVCRTAIGARSKRTRIGELE
jgi:hypothetical protein